MQLQQVVVPALRSVRNLSQAVRAKQVVQRWVLRNRTRINMDCERVTILLHHAGRYRLQGRLLRAQVYEDRAHRILDTIPTT
jgi:hypothetical protein